MALEFERFALVEEDGQHFAVLICGDGSALDGRVDTTDEEYLYVRLKVELGKGEAVAPVKSSLLEQVKAEVDRIFAEQVAR